MEKILVFLILAFLSFLFGILGKKISYEERKIFKQKFYFPLFIFVLSLTSIVFIFININLSVLFFSFGLIALSWYL